MRPADLAREHGLSTQAVRNYERDGFLPPAARTPSGYRVYTEVHAAALRAFLALVAAYGHATAGGIMHAVHAGDAERALTLVDRGHAQLARDRETLNTVRNAIGHLTAGPAPGPATTAWSVGELAHHLGVTAATVRAWERAGILVPARDRATGYRIFDAADVRDAELTHLLRRGGHPLARIATVVDQVRTAGGTESLTQALETWRGRLTARGLAMLDAAALLGTYLRSRP
ncbi:MerR family DNA-binding transcriptional regulator [Amycolatopsis vancoresmycina]|uniref:MerR family transcriptional regulator n=1 Tax=Amycolatopsis vancoresmycina DSM 44592 TaxID=1292037 RepID=R1I1H5_9PSEU|nr:MerR family DNA-binding transcriptional regulator [Amycolatopsis vancoresmycina]EOD69670.1 MerR family transcriptional regulator [Amycolatopsis vancoresmycina DSM 44592]